MTNERKVIRAKVGLLELARQLGNVSQACKVMGHSRDSFYRFQELYEKGGEIALAEITRRNSVFTFAQAGSIGVKSGEWAGKYREVKPERSSSARTSGALWARRLSITSTASGLVRRSLGSSTRSR